MRLEQNFNRLLEVGEGATALTPKRIEGHQGSFRSYLGEDNTIWGTLISSNPQKLRICWILSSQLLARPTKSLSFCWKVARSIQSDWRSVHQNSDCILAVELMIQDIWTSSFRMGLDNWGDSGDQFRNFHHQSIPEGQLLITSSRKTHWRKSGCWGDSEDYDRSWRQSRRETNR